MQNEKIQTNQPAQVRQTPTVPPVMKKLEPETKVNRTIIGGIFIVIILLGIGTGYLLSRPTGTTTTAGGTVVSTDGKSFGSTDTKTFADSTIGTIEKGGINNEGTHKLIREGGESQTACLVSSILDLDEFVGKKVKVWSNTMDAKVCPWLMDVGRIELQ